MELGAFLNLTFGKLSSLVSFQSVRRETKEGKSGPREKIIRIKEGLSGCALRVELFNPLELLIATIPFRSCTDNA